MRGFWFQAHWIVGITAGIVLAVVGATGAVLSLEHTVVEWLNEDVRRVEARSGEPLALGAVLERLATSHPGRRVQRIETTNEPGAAWRITLADESQGARERRDGARPRGETLHLDPYSGEVLASGAERGAAFFRATMQLHRWLVVGPIGDRDSGRQIVGACTALLVMLALSGLYLRWPGRRRADWRTWLTFSTALRGRRFLWHLHAVLGTWVLPLYLAMALTGLYWSYEPYRNALYALAGAERPERPAEAGHGVPAPEPQALDDAWQVFTAAVGGEYSSVTIIVPPAEKPIVMRYLAADPPHERAFNMLEVDAAQRLALRHERYADKSLGERLVSSMLPLHSGTFFGAPGAVLFALASLGMPVFTVTGWMMYLARKRRREAADEPAAGALAAARRRR